MVWLIVLRIILVLVTMICFQQRIYIPALISFGAMMLLFVATRYLDQQKKLPEWLIPLDYALNGVSSIVLIGYFSSRHLLSWHYFIIFVLAYGTYLSIIPVLIQKRKKTLQVAFSILSWSAIGLMWGTIASGIIYYVLITSFPGVFWDIYYKFSKYIIPNISIVVEAVAFFFFVQRYRKALTGIERDFVVR